MTRISLAAEQKAQEEQDRNVFPLRRLLDASRNLSPRTYPRMVEILQLLGSSSLMATQAKADFINEMADHAQQDFQLANPGSKDWAACFLDQG